MNWAGFGARALIASPLAFLIGISLGALGGGGSILAVPALVYGAGESAKAATTTSLIVVGVTSLIGMFGHLKAGRVRFLPGLLFGLAGIGGSFAGSALNRFVPNQILLVAFSVLMLVAAWQMWLRNRRPAADPGASDAEGAATAAVAPPDGPDAAGAVAPAAGAPTAVATKAKGRSAASVVIRVLLVGTGVGLLTGFFGVGGGFVVVPGLVLALGYEMPVAVGTSLLVIVVNTAESLVFRLAGNASIDWGVAVPFTVAAVIGVLIGTLIAGRVPSKKLTVWFVWLLIALAIYTGVRSALGI